MSTRASGILLHISSLPSAFGIGDMGPAAYAFAKTMAEAGQLCWQFLPLSPTSPAIGNSPYSSPSAFAGNPILISPELLVRDGFASWADVDDSCRHLAQGSQDGQAAGHAEGGDPARVDYEAVHRQRGQLLLATYEKNRPQLENDAGFRDFCAAEAAWLEDYALFRSIKEQHSGAEWRSWPEALKYRHHEALQAWRREHWDSIQRTSFIQYLFYRQWRMLRGHCNRLGLRLVGDLPIYVTYDSADVWANPRYFKLDEQLEPYCVAGVPPDYFSETGQRWGNPVYNWEALARDGFAWWASRITHNLGLTDLVRIDHFRGFAGYWEIAASEPTAINGKWVEAPGMELFRTIRRRLTGLPIIAEDLGVITADVRELRDTFNFPGMKILQFAFGGNLAENPHIPFCYPKNSVVYTGTHDNSPTRGWFMDAASHEEKKQLDTYVGHSVTEDDAHEVFMRLAMASRADLAIIPVQDVLGLGSEGRMNTPATSSGNWAWRMRAEQAGPDNYKRLAMLTEFFARNS